MNISYGGRNEGRKDRLDLIEGGLDPVLSSSFGISRRGSVSSGGTRDGENSVSADTYINALFREAGQAGPRAPATAFALLPQD